MHARLLILGAAALAPTAGCEASSSTKSEVESALRQAIVASLMPAKVECKLEHDEMRPEKLRVRCQSSELNHMSLANRVKDVLVKNCASLHRAAFSKVEIDVPRDGGGDHTVWGNMNDDCDDWLSLGGLH